MAHIARSNEAEKATNETAKNVAELGKGTADQAVHAAREATDRAQDTARRGVQYAQQAFGATVEVERALARRSAVATAELGRAFAELLEQQARQNVEAVRALNRAVDWDGVARVQAELVRTSLERGAEFVRRYFEVVQAVVSSAASATREQAKKAA